MKFLCDRCNTRYSIGDDRVRGKILKIRCKSCANVITVREGMSHELDAPPPEPAVRGKKSTTGAPDALEERSAALRGGATRDPMTAASQPAGRAALASARQAPGRRAPHEDPARGEPGNALNAAFASAMTRPPPALDEEWYVSIDGDQAGPFSLTEAQRWVADQPAEGELHCWSEGFDDWLPVDKVSHFRGLRKRPAAPSAPPPLPRSAGAPPRSAIAEDEPEPLFAATMASLERGAPAMPGAGLASPAAPSARATPPAGSPIASRGNPAGRRSNAAQDAALAPRPARPDARPDASPDARPEVRAAASAPAMAARPRIGDPFDAGAAGEPETQLEAMPFDDAPAAARQALPPARGKAVAARDLAASERDPAPGAPPVAAAPEPASAVPTSGAVPGDDLDIGEVSRVVKLADLARSSRSSDAQATRRTGPAVALATRATGMTASLRSTGANPSLAFDDPAGLEGDPGLAAPPAAHSHRRGLIALLAVAAAMVLGVVGAVVVFVATGDDSTSNNLGTVHAIDTSRPEDPITHRPIGSTSPAPAPVPAPQPARPIAHPRPTPGPAGGSSQVALAPPGNALGGDEIEDVARKHQDMTQRCYMRSQRGADAILVGDVKKIAVTLTIDRDGNVSELQLSDHAADNLGKCLSGAIKSWKFRPSSGGTFRFSLNFVSG